MAFLTRNGGGDIVNMSLEQARAEFASVIRSALGLGSAATQDGSAFEAAGLALLKSASLSDVADANAAKLFIGVNAQNAILDSTGSITVSVPSGSIPVPVWRDSAGSGKLVISGSGSSYTISSDNGSADSGKSVSYVCAYQLP